MLSIVQLVSLNVETNNDNAKERISQFTNLSSISSDNRNPASDSFIEPSIGVSILISKINSKEDVKTSGKSFKALFSFADNSKLNSIARNNYYIHCIYCQNLIQLRRLNI